MVNKIFSLKYEDFNGKIYKVFYILGLKIKFFNLKRTLKDHIKKNRRFENIINEYIGDLCKSLVTLLCEINNSSELICIQSESIVFILSKYFFNCDKQFIFDFLSFDFLIMKQTPVITSLNKNCPLYKEHFEKLKTIGGGEQEIAWKYLNRNIYLEKTVLKVNSNNKLEICRELINEQTDNFVQDYKYKMNYVPSKTEYIEGITLSQYLKDRDIEEIKKILHKFFLSFFSIYENKKTGKISSFDYNINNIIINHDGFYLIDPGMKLEQEMPKCWLIYLLCDLGLGNKELYSYFIKEFNIHDESQYCKEFIKMQENDFIDKIKNIKTEMPEVKKIFGKTAFIPEYDINSIKNIKSEVY